MMKKLILKTAKVVGPPGKKAWSQVHTFLPKEEEKLKKRGQLVVVVSLVCLVDGIEPAIAGREIISRVYEEYYGRLEETALTRLKGAIKRVIDEAQGEAEVEIEAGVVKEGMVHLVSSGKGRIFLRRGKKLALLLAEEGKVTGISGPGKEGDLFFLGTSAFFKAVSSSVVRRLLTGVSFQEMVEQLAPFVHHQEKATAAAVIFKLEEASLPPEEVALKKRKERKKERYQWLKSSFRLLFQRVYFFLFKVTQKLGKRAIYLAEERRKVERKKRTMATVALTLIVLLVVSLVLGWRQKKKEREKGGGAVILAQAEQKKEEAVAILSLNPLKAKELLLTAQEMVKTAKKGKENQEALKLEKEIEDLLSRLVGKYQVEPKLFFDLKLIREEAEGKELALWEEKLLVLDRSHTAVYRVGIKKKRSSFVAGGKELDSPQKLAVSGSKIYLLLPKGVMEIGKEGRKTLVIKKEEEWGEVIDLKAFAGNLYLLDKDKGIWKYPRIEEGFGTLRRWLQEEVDLKEAVAMAIDGSIWVLQSDGQVLKFTRGQREIFKITGLDQPLLQPQALFTDSEQEYLYLLDNNNSRVVVVDKGGEFHTQYLWSGQRDFTSLVVSEKEKKIFLLEGSKIYEISIFNS